MSATPDADPGALATWLRGIAGNSELRGYVELSLEQARHIADALDAAAGRAVPAEHAAVVRGQWERNVAALRARGLSGDALAVAEAVALIENEDWIHDAAVADLVERLSAIGDRLDAAAGRERKYAELFGPFDGEWTDLGWTRNQLQMSNEAFIAAADRERALREALEEIARECDMGETAVRNGVVHHIARRALAGSG